MCTSVSSTAGRHGKAMAPSKTAKAISNGELSTRLLTCVLICFLVFGVVPVCIVTGTMQQRPDQDFLHLLQHLRYNITRYELNRSDGRVHNSKLVGLIKTQAEALKSTAQLCSQADRQYAEQLQSSILDYVGKVGDNQIAPSDRTRFVALDSSIEKRIVTTRIEENNFYFAYRELAHYISFACALLAVFLVVALISYLAYRRRTESQLKEYNDALNLALSQTRQALENQRAAEQRKEEIIAIVSHELRTPLANASMRLELLDAGVQGQLTEQQIDSVRKTRENLGYLIHLINDLLCLERLNNYQEEVLVFSEVDVDGIVQRSFERVESLAQTKNIELKYEPAHFTVRGESTILEQVLVNLLSNAIKFSPHNTAVTVAARHGEQTDEIAVTDQGPGIPDDMLQSVFDKFKQVRHDVTGTGLGLNICKEIVAHHHGVLSVRNNDAPGCTFSIELPNVKSTIFDASNHSSSATKTTKIIAHST